MLLAHPAGEQGGNQLIALDAVVEGVDQPLERLASAGPLVQRRWIPRSGHDMKLAIREDRLARLAEDAQQEEEEVDEVEVEGERAHDRRAPLGLAGKPLLVDLRQLLHVVRGQS